MYYYAYNAYFVCKLKDDSVFQRTNIFSKIRLFYRKEGFLYIV